MGKQVICYIQAFDCEHTIEAAMQSVLDQTYENWLCFVMSNGNKNTIDAPNWSLDVIKSVAARDPRFVVLNKRINRLDVYIPMLYYLAECFPDSYVCSLDADDEYRNDFFERGVALAEEHGLDIVACGTEIVLKEDVEAKEGVLLSRRELKEDLIVSESEFTSRFRVYKPFFNEMWGKLYHAGLFGAGYDRAYVERNLYRRFLPDTLFTIDNLSRSRSIGILSGTSHRFYQYKRRRASNATVLTNSLVANWQAERLFASKSLFSVYDTYETLMAFLRAHGEIENDLYEYMQAVLFGWLGDYYQRTLVPTQSEKNFAELTSSLIFHPKFDGVMLYQDSGKYNNLRDHEKRIEFCRRLRNMALGQKAIRNRSRWGKDNLPCSPATRRKLDRVIQKLEETIQALLEVQRKGSGVC